MDPDATETVKQMSAFVVGQMVVFTGPSNVTVREHGLAPGQTVRAVIDEVWDGEGEYTVTFDGGRVMARESELVIE